MQYNKRIDSDRLYNHSKIAQRMCTEIVNTHGHLLSNIKVDMSLYGRFNSAGVGLGEPEPVPNFYIPERDVHFYDADWFVTQEEQEDIDDYEEKISFEAKTELPEPSSLLQIAQLGVENEYIATSALAELMDQLYNQTQVDVLVLMDDYNWCFRRSSYLSFRYSSMRGLNSTIPPYHMSLIRLFMKMDGHKLRRGFKVFANSNRTIYKHYFAPEKINFNWTA